MNAIYEHLQLAIDLSQRINQVISDQDWELAETLDKNRMQLLESICAMDGYDTHDPKTREMLLEIEQINQQGLSACEDARVDLQDESKKIRKGRQAVSAYNKQSRNY